MLGIKLLTGIAHEFAACGFGANRSLVGARSDHDLIGVRNREYSATQERCRCQRGPSDTPDHRSAHDVARRRPPIRPAKERAA